MHLISLWPSRRRLGEDGFPSDISLHSILQSAGPASARACHAPDERLLPDCVGCRPFWFVSIKDGDDILARVKMPFRGTIPVLESPLGRVTKTENPLEWKITFPGEDEGESIICLRQGMGGETGEDFLAGLDDD